MDEQPTMPRTELEAEILELYEMLSPSKQRIMILSAVLSAAHNGTAHTKEAHR